MKKSIGEKNELQLRLKADRSNQLLDNEFKQTKKQVELRISGAKTKHFKNKFNECRGDIGATWKVVEDMVPGLKKGNQNASFDDPLKKAEEFNQYFASVGETAFKNFQVGMDNDIAEREMRGHNNLHSLTNIPNF